MRQRVFEIIRKEFLQTMREPRMRLMLFVPPLLQLVIFGFAVNLDVENSRLAWVDLDRSPASRSLRAQLDASPYFEIAAEPPSQSEAEGLMDRDAVHASVTVLPGFARDIQRGIPASVQVLINGSNSNTASVVGAYMAQALARYGAGIQAGQQSLRLSAGGAAGPVDRSLPGVDFRTRVWFNQELRSRNYYVPGVLANIITVVTLILTSMAIVREKELGTMEQLMVTPIRPLELVIGKTLPFALVGLLDMALVTVAALLLFHIPFRGSGWLLLACSSLFLLTTLGAGLFISTISHTQQQALMASFFFFMPAFMLSGFAFPIRNMPLPVQWLTYLNPIRYFLEILRGIFLKGSGVDVLWPQMAALLCIGVTVLGLSVARFKKRLD